MNIKMVFANGGEQIKTCCYPQLKRKTQLASCYSLLIPKKEVSVLIEISVSLNIEVHLLL